MQTHDPRWLEAMYNNRARVPEHGAILARWAADSLPVRSDPRARLDLAYGDGPGEMLDLFLPQGTAAGGAGGEGGAPVLVFIHGGYWRSLDKADHAFIAPAFTQRGAAVAVLNYALCPQVRISDIARQMVRAVVWLWRNAPGMGLDRRRMLVAGHSAGGHLAAMLLACHWPRWDDSLPDDVLRSALSISGLFCLEPLRHASFLQDSLRLSADEARRCSPALWPAPSPDSGRRLAAVVGSQESEAFVQQTLAIREAWGPLVVPVCETVPGCNHFTVLDALAQPGSRLHELAWDWLLDNRGS